MWFKIAGIGSESHNPSSRESVAANDDEESHLCGVTSSVKVENANAESFLEPEILKYLQREVDHLAIETEFDPKVCPSWQSIIIFYVEYCRKFQ